MGTLLLAFANRSIAAKLMAMAAAGVLFKVLVAAIILVIAKGKLTTERTARA